MSSAATRTSESEDVTEEELRRAAEKLLDGVDNAVVHETCEAVLRSLEPDDSQS